MRPSTAQRTAGSTAVKPNTPWLDMEDAINEQIAFSRLLVDRLTLSSEIDCEANLEGAIGAGVISLNSRLAENLCTQFNRVHAQWAANERKL